MAGWLWFLLGLCTGALFGVLVMACMQIGRINEARERCLREQEKRP